MAKNVNRFSFVGPDNVERVVNLMPKFTGDTREVAIIIPPIPGKTQLEGVSSAGHQVGCDPDYRNYRITPGSLIHNTYSSTSYATRTGDVKATALQITSGLEGGVPLKPLAAAQAVVEIALTAMGVEPGLAAEQATTSIQAVPPIRPRYT